MADDDGGAAAPDDLRVMTHDASDEELLAAIAANHVDWMNRLARASAGLVRRDAGVHWTCVSRTTTDVTAAVIQPPGPDVRCQLDRLLAFCREQEVHRVAYWAFSDAYADPLGSWLGARGFRLGSRPHWMAVDLWSLPDLPPLRENAHAGLRVTDTFTAVEDSELPCFHPDTVHVREAMAAARPRRVWHVVQWRDGLPVGQVSYCVTDGDLGVCGLHDTIVIAPARATGFGIARVEWMFRFALDLGCRYVVTNAADESAGYYRMLGFRSLAYGQTWWLPDHVLRTPAAPGPVAFAEAIGQGDLAALDSLALRTGVNDPLPNQMTPLRFAGAARRPESARWLLAHGAEPDVIAAWDLGWKAEARELLAEHPGLLNRQRPRSGKSLLHVAVERDDPELATMLLDAGIDVSLTDNQFDSTALQWAQELNRGRIAAAIRRYRP